MYKILYKGFNGGWQLSDEFDDLGKARAFKNMLLDRGYPEAKIITEVE